MREIIRLNGKSCEADKARIEDSWQSSPVYVLDDENTKLCDYLECLYMDYELEDNILYRMHICKEYRFLPDSVTLIQGSLTAKPSNISELLKFLREEDNAGIAHIIVENNDRVLLANILQQLIYIDYPITRVNMKLRREYKDAEKTTRFIARLDRLQQGAERAVEIIKGLTLPEDAENAEELFRKRADALAAFETIREEIKKAQNLEMKVAVAASKKTGKSVIVNSMLGMELAPTSLRLATPNTCVYRRSDDGIFYLNYQGQKKAYTDPTALRRDIQREFRHAQNDQAGGYAIEDMEISYVSNGNNFETYTVHDTPGPDAAGTGHWEHAKRSMDACDVAVFAIDYSKYLTTPEVEYLKSIKDIFEREGKFYTLIFTINRIDMVLQDKDAKSRVIAIDFIRNRMREIDPQYGDCVIFATSAQDYFYAVEIENAAKEGQPYAQQFRPLLEGDLLGSTYSAMEALEDKSGVSGLKTVLSNVSGEVGKMKTQLGYRQVSLEDLKAFSGMPQFMSYVAYISQSKAREEIVNKITRTIAEQRAALQIIIDYIANVEKLINADESKITEIQGILEKYETDVTHILQEEITEQEAQSPFFQAAQARALAARVNTLAKRNGFPVPLDRLLNSFQENIVNSVGTQSAVYNTLWNRFYDAQMERLSVWAGKTVDVDPVYNELNLSVKDVQNILETYTDAFCIERITAVREDVEAMRVALQLLQNGRQTQLKQRSDLCQTQLQKTGIPLNLPPVPEFDCEISSPNMDSIQQYNQIRAFQMNMGSIVKKFNPVRNIWENLKNWTNVTMYQYGRVKKKLTQEEMSQAVNGVKGDFLFALTDIDIYGGLRNWLEALSKVMDDIRRDLRGQFDATTSACQKNIADFRAAIDDRNRYEEHIDELNHMKTLIQEINRASEDFMTVWGEIVQPGGGSSAEQ